MTAQTVHVVCAVISNGRAWTKGAPEHSEWRFGALLTTPRTIGDSSRIHWHSEVNRQKIVPSWAPLTPKRASGSDDPARHRESRRRFPSAGPARLLSDHDRNCVKHIGSCHELRHELSRIMARNSVYSLEPFAGLSAIVTSYKQQQQQRKKERGEGGGGALPLKSWQFSVSG